MARKKTPAASPEGEHELPTTADLTVLDALPGGPPPKSLRELSSAFVELLATPSTQSRLRELAPDLKSFKGCNVDAGLQRVDETNALIKIGERVQNAYVRVRQRTVENNAWLRSFQTNLAQAQARAEVGSPVALGLAAMVKRRKAAIGVPKAAKTRAKKRRAKAKPKA